MCFGPNFNLRNSPYNSDVSFKVTKYSSQTRFHWTWNELRDVKKFIHIIPGARSTLRLAGSEVRERSWGRPEPIGGTRYELDDVGTVSQRTIGGRSESVV